MKKILIAIMLLFSTATMAQRLSVLGIEMGTGIDEAERRLARGLENMRFIVQVM